jgi:hypothetical protein
MFRRWIPLLVAAPFLLASCATVPPPPVTMVGPETQRLAGEWNGEYTSFDRGRSGLIHFRLEAGTDSASGEVLMQPRHSYAAGPRDGTPASPPAPMSQALPIRFVLAEGDSVFGVLDPYDDPESGSTLVTRFAGRIVDDRIEGLYESVNTARRETYAGRWSVKREARSSE